MVDVGGERSEIAGFHGDVLGERAIAGPVRQPEDALDDGETGGSVAEFRHDARDLVSRHGRGAVAAGAVGRGCGPVATGDGRAMATAGPGRSHGQEDCAQQRGLPHRVVGGAHAAHAAGQEQRGDVESARGSLRDVQDVGDH